MRALGILTVVACALCACRATPRAEVAARVAQVDGERLRGHVEGLCELGPRQAGDEEATARTLEWLRGEIEALGLEAREESVPASFGVLRAVEGGDGRSLVRRTEEHVITNLLVDLPGRGKPWEVIEVGAHYDTVFGSPGADDNASGVAILLELARVLREVELERTVRLCFFAAEECGLLGSTLHAALLARQDEERLLGAIVLDVVGYADHAPDSQRMPVRIPLLFDPPRTADFIMVAGNFPSGGIGNLVEDSADRYAPELEYYSVNRLAGFVSDGWRSDHASYWRYGLRAIQLGDSADMRSPHYHRPSDLPDTLDYAFLLNVARAVTGAVVEWAD